MPTKTLHLNAHQPLANSKKADRKALSLAAASSFDILPNSAYVRQPVVQALFACSSATVWRYVKIGIIPAPKKLGPRTTAWNVGQLRAALGV